jgi:uridine kinase
MNRPSAIDSVVRLIESHRPTALILVGIGGHGGAGKSTLASRITEVVDGAQIVATDSFWNGTEFQLGRLRTQVVDALLAGREATYDEWDWSGRRPGQQRTVTPHGVVIIEGVCALHQMFRDDLAVRIWVDAPYDVRLSRGVARDGEASRRTWVDVWMPNEDAYVRRDDPVACAQLVVDGTRPFD